MEAARVRSTALRRAAAALEGSLPEGAEDPVLEAVLTEITRLGPQRALETPPGGEKQPFDLQNGIVALGPRGRLARSGSLRTTVLDLERIFAEAGAADRIVLWMHGGLVSEGDATRLAWELGPELARHTRAFPLFLAWKSGPLEVLPLALRDLLLEQGVVTALLRWARHVLGLPTGGEKRGMLGLESLDPHPFADEPEPGWEDRVDVTRPEDLQTEMEADAGLLEALRELRGTRGGLELRGPRGAELLDPGLVERLAPRSPPLEGRGLVTALGAARAVLSIVGRVRDRYGDPLQWNGWRDTLTEEVIRETGAPHLVGSAAWQRMKANAREAYEDGGGGALLAAYLAGWLAEGEGRALHVVAHSAGSYHAGHLLSRLATLRPGADPLFASLSLLAPACDLPFFGEHFLRHAPRIGARRLFALTTEQEDRERMIPHLYQGSLLNLVSGLFEAEPGWPLLGMNRFLSSDLPLAAAAVGDLFDGELILAPDDQGRSHSLKHGGFWRDPATLTSVMELVGRVADPTDDPVDPAHVDDTASARRIGAEIAGPALELRPEHALEARPRLPVAWADDERSVDTAHLGVELSPTPFRFTADALERLVALNHFRLLQDDRVLFGLRGCTLAGDADWVDFTPAVELVEAIPDHTHLRCVLGVWQRATGLVAVFRGSTVPNWRYLEDHVQGRSNANMLLTGAYRYRVGRHRDMPGAFRLSEPSDVRVAVLRPRRGKATIVLDRTDPIEAPSGAPDNIHPAFNPAGGVHFSSAGCPTVQGTWNPVTQDPLGPWAEFRLRAGLRRTPDDAEVGRRFDYVLLTGREARLASTERELTGLERLRFGSRGPAVRALQQGLGVTPDGILGAGTVRALAAWQREQDGGADGIASAGTLRRLAPGGAGR